jgi:hypothetical protein
MSVSLEVEEEMLLLLLVLLLEEAEEDLERGEGWWTLEDGYPPLLP